MTLWLDVPFLLLLVLLALLATTRKRLLGAIVALAVYGSVLALEWTLLGAVDVAFTEAVIGAGVGTVFLLSALRRTGEDPFKSRRRRLSAAGLLACLALGVLLVAATAHLPRWSDPQAPAAVHVSPRYIEQALDETATPNVVTAVLADYRSLDTLIEVTVVFAGAMAVLFVLGGRRP